MDTEFPITSFSTIPQDQSNQISRIEANKGTSTSNHVTFEQNAHAPKPNPSPSQHIVKSIKKDRHKKGIHQMLVVYEEDKNDNGHWVAVSELNCPDLVSQFLDQKKDQKDKNDPNEAGKQGNPQKKTNNNLRAIKEIRGMIASPKYKFIYVVEFSDSPTDEYISWADMRKHYSKQLLKFYESHIEDDNLDESEQGDSSTGQTTVNQAVNVLKSIANVGISGETKSSIQRPMSVQPHSVSTVLPILKPQ
mgnify:CR=1 FL=1